MQIVYYFKETRFTKLLLEQARYVKNSELISTDDVKLLNLLAKYVHKAFDLRNNYVNNQVW